MADIKFSGASDGVTAEATDRIGAARSDGGGGWLSRHITPAYIRTYIHGTYGANIATWLGTPSSANLAAAITDETGSGALVFGTSPTLVTPVLGTPSSGTLTNCTGLPVSSGISGLGTGVATFLATPSSANLASAVTDETGSGALVFATSPTLVTPALGTPASGTLTNCTGLPVAGGGTGATTAQAACSNLAAVYILKKEGVPVTAPANDTNNNVIETVTVSAGIMGDNGALRYFCRTTQSNNANVKTIRVYIGSSGSGTGGTLIGSFAAANSPQNTVQVLISNSNAANVQETTAVGQTNINVIATAVDGAIDTDSAWELVIAFQKATGTDTMTLQQSTTELLSNGA